jgi:hypothetical protein
MSAASDYLELKVLDHTLATAAYTAPSAVYLALFTSDPSVGSTAENLEAGTLTNEVTTAGSTAYARKAVTFAAASAGSATTNATVTFDTATADWGTITHLAIMDGATEGADNVLYYGELDTHKLIQAGDTFQVTTGNLTVTLA